MSKPAKPQLDEMIRAPEYQIRAILLSLCHDDRVRKKALDHYSALRQYDQPTKALKRKAINDLFVCVQCGSPFSNEDNEEGTCVYHPGVTEIKDDDDFWADTDDWMEPDSEHMREDCPEGFEWSCCQKQIDKPGCEKGKHEAHPDRSKRTNDSKASLGMYVPRSEQHGVEEAYKGYEGNEGDEGDEDDEEDSGEEEDY